MLSIIREKAPEQPAGICILMKMAEVIKGLSTSTHLASGVPGSVDGLYKAHANMGKLSFEDVIQPAIDLAERAFL